MMNENKEKMLYWLCVLGLFRLFFYECIVVVLSFIHLSDYADVVFYTGFSALFITYLMQKRTLDKKVFYTVLTISLIVLIGYVNAVLVGDSSFEMDPDFNLVKIVLFFSILTLLFSSIEDIDAFCSFATKVSCVCIVFELALFLHGVTEGKIDTYNMTGGYLLALFFMFQLNEFAKHKSVYNLIFMILAAIQIVLNASRGALLLILVFSILSCLKRVSEIKHRALIILVSAILLGCLFANYYSILSEITKLLDVVGIESRNVSSILDLSNQTDSSRGALQGVIRNEFKNMPIFGYGFCGSWMFIGTYCHNFIYDMYIEWGFFLGTVFIALVAFFSIKSVRNINTRQLAAILVIYFLVHNMLSSTYLHDETFWCMIGVFINSNRYSNNTSV